MHISTVPMSGITETFRVERTKGIGRPNEIMQIERGKTQSSDHETRFGKTWVPGVNHPSGKRPQEHQGWSKAKC